jgi:hypothetical protein
MELQWNRITALAKIRVNQRIRQTTLWVLGFLVVSSLIIFGAIIDTDVKNDELVTLSVFHQFFFIALLIVGVVKLASNAFEEMRSPKQIFTGFLLPASNIEKWFFEFLFSLIIWTLISAILYLGYAQGVNFVLSQMVGFEFVWFQLSFMTDELSNGNLGIVKNIVLIHSISLLGATFFRKRVMLKIILATAIVYGVWLAVFTIVWTSIYTGSTFLYPNEAIEFILIQNNLTEELIDVVQLFTFAITGILFPALLYYLSFVRMKKMQL